MCLYKTAKREKMGKTWNNNESTTVLIVNMKPACFVCGADVLGFTWQEWNHAVVMNKRSTEAGAFRGMTHKCNLITQHGFNSTAMRKLNRLITIFRRYWCCNDWCNQTKCLCFSQNALEAHATDVKAHHFLCWWWQQAAHTCTSPLKAYKYLLHCCVKTDAASSAAAADKALP